MATGIKDKVAILGMGCAKFGERWNDNAEDLMVEAFSIMININIGTKKIKNTTSIFNFFNQPLYILIVVFLRGVFHAIG